MQQNVEEWEQLISAAAEFQKLIPGCVLVGGSATAIYAGHRLSIDTDHVLEDLPDRFESLLEFLEKHKDWKTKRIRPPKLILGNFMGVETGLRQLIRLRPLETQWMEYRGKRLKIPTKPEMFRIKGWLILFRNATRDYIDFAAIFRTLREEKSIEALKDFDTYYQDVYQGNDSSPLTQLVRQLSEPKPYDLDEIDISSYKGIVPPLDRWENISAVCNQVSVLIADHLTEGE